MADIFERLAQGAAAADRRRRSKRTARVPTPSCKGGKRPAPALIQKTS